MLVDQKSPVHWEAWFLGGDKKKQTIIYKQLGKKKYMCA